jgi:hypothetical protein
VTCKKTEGVENILIYTITPNKCKSKASVFGGLNEMNVILQVLVYLYKFGHTNSLIVWLTSHEAAVLFSHQISTNHQPASGHCPTISQPNMV